MAATICPRPVTLTFDLLTLKSVWESHVPKRSTLSTFNKVDRVEFNFVASVYWALYDAVRVNKVFVIVGILVRFVRVNNRKLRLVMIG